LFFLGVPVRETGRGIIIESAPKSPFLPKSPLSEWSQ